VAYGDNALDGLFPSLPGFHFYSDRIDLVGPVLLAMSFHPFQERILGKLTYYKIDSYGFP